MNSVVITRAGGRARQGRHIRQTFVRLLDDLPRAVWDLKNQILDATLRAVHLSGPQTQRSTGSTTA